jgi:hypothetical protein
MRFLPLLLLLAACAPADTAGAPADTAVALHPDAPERRDLGALHYRGGLHLEHEDVRFGGISALHASADGSRFIAVSDRAFWIAGRLEWTTEGDLAAAQIETIAPLLSREGAALEGEAGDSEAIAHLGEGRFAVSFERRHRINLYDLGPNWTALDAPGQTLPAPEARSGFENNGGMEGLTALEDGALLAGVESAEDGARQLWMSTGDAWRRIRLAAEPDFGLTALEAHDASIYALERAWSRETGNRIRILRLPAAALDDALDSETLIEPELLGALTREQTVDNFEALSVFAREEERILLIASDDNFSDRQRTLLMAFSVSE